MPTRRTKSRPTQQPAEADASSDIWEMRRQVARKLTAFIADWRRCDLRTCRRRRQCSQLDDCRSLAALPPVSDKEWGRTSAALLREIAQRRAELAAARGQPAAQCDAREASATRTGLSR